jgi:hypothetical protein
LQPVLVLLFAHLFFKLGISEDFTGTITVEKMSYMLLIFSGVYLTSVGAIRKKMGY